MSRSDSTVSSTEHYESLLADVYDWMQGGWEERAEQARVLFDKLGLIPATPGAVAIDLGAGTGFQSVPLATAGYRVLAIDSSPAMLARLDLRANADPAVAARISTMGADLNAPNALRTLIDSHAGAGSGASSSSDGPLTDPYRAASPGSAHLIVCMGDTVSHLADHATVAELLDATGRALVAGGRLVVSFRDAAQLPADHARFIPVRSDEDRIFTCFVEEVENRRLRIHDLLHVRDGDGFTQHLSSYTKIRIEIPWVDDQLRRAGYRDIAVATDAGMSIITAVKRSE